MTAMRFHMPSLIDGAEAVLAAIESRDIPGLVAVGTPYLAALPPDDFGDVQPGVGVYTSLEEHAFHEVLPYLRGTVRHWLRWAESPDRSEDWPEPQRLRWCIQGLYMIRGPVPEVEPVPV